MPTSKVGMRCTEFMCMGKVLEKMYDKRTVAALNYIRSRYLRNRKVSIAVSSVRSVVSPDSSKLY
jgi:hypothetical protein